MRWSEGGHKESPVRPAPPVPRGYKEQLLRWEPWSRWVQPVHWARRVVKVYRVRPAQPVLRDYRELPVRRERRGFKV